MVATLAPLQVTILALVAAGAPLVALSRDPVRMVVVNSFYNWALVILFVVFGAPDVALSMLVVGSVGYPLILLVAIARSRRRTQ